MLNTLETSVHAFHAATATFSYFQFVSSESRISFDILATLQGGSPRMDSDASLFSSTLKLSARPTQFPVPWVPGSFHCVKHHLCDANQNLRNNNASPPQEDQDYRWASAPVLQSAMPVAEWALPSDMTDRKRLRALNKTHFYFDSTVHVDKELHAIYLWQNAQHKHVYLELKRVKQKLKHVSKIVTHVFIMTKNGNKISVL